MFVDELVLLTLERMACGQTGKPLNIIFTKNRHHHEQCLKICMQFPISVLIRTILVPKNKKLSNPILHWMGGEVSFIVDANEGSVEMAGNQEHQQLFCEIFRNYELISEMLSAPQTKWQMIKQAKQK